VRAAQAVAVVAIALPALALVLWPLLRRGALDRRVAPGPDADRRLELSDERATIYRALRELHFDHEAGHLSDDDYRDLRARYETRAAEVIRALDALGPARDEADDDRHRPAPAVVRSPWRRPVATTVGALLFLVFGLALGLGIGRYTEVQPPAPPMANVPPASPAGTGSPAGGTGPLPGASGSALSPDMLAGMLRAARQSLVDGRYQEAIAAYQAVLKRDEKNVDAMTHLGLIVAIGGHADIALETWDKALKIDPKYAPAHLYRGQVLYEVKHDYPGALTSWERYIALVPQGEERARVQALMQEARSRQAGDKK